MDYDFIGSGIITPMTMTVNVDNLQGGYTRLKLFLVDGQNQVAILYSTSQQNISRWIQRHLEVERQIKEKGSINKVTA